MWRLFHIVSERVEKSCCGGTVDQIVVEIHRNMHDLPDLYSIVHDDRFSEGAVKCERYDVGTSKRNMALRLMKYLMCLKILDYLNRLIGSTPHLKKCAISASDIMAITCLY